MDKITCQWQFERMDGDGNIHYGSGCGWDYMMDSVSPAQSGYRYCPNCGWEIEVEYANDSAACCGAASLSGTTWRWGRRGGDRERYDEIRNAYEQELMKYKEDEMEELDSGYQVVLSCGPRTRIEVVGWLATLVGYKFATGEHIESIEHFQILQLDDGQYSCVAIARVVQPRKRRWA